MTDKPTLTCNTCGLTPHEFVEERKVKRNVEKLVETASKGHYKYGSELYTANMQVYRCCKCGKERCWGEVGEKSRKTMEAHRRCA